LALHGNLLRVIVSTPLKQCIYQSTGHVKMAMLFISALIFFFC